MPTRLSLALLALALVTGCSSQPPAVVPDGGGAATLPPSGQAAMAEGLYRQHCAVCHDQGVSGAPKRAALEARTPQFIKQALTAGVMKAQGAALKPHEIAILSDYLGRNAKPARTAEGPRCDKPLAFNGAPLWNRWGGNLANTRFQSAAAAGIDAASVKSLELAWAFGFPDAQRARSQPALTREALFTGSQSGRVYALDAATGCIHWTFDAGAEVRNAPVIGTDADGRPKALYFADFAATVYALDARTGRELWRKSVRDHPDGTVTGSLALHGGTLYVPMSSTEVVSAFDDGYACCTFRGGVTALAEADGKTRWRWHTVDRPRKVGSNARGVAIMAPSGAPVWSTPTIDPKRGVLYVGTGENYTSPANGVSDAIVALDLASGRPRWVRQVTAGDAWNAACGATAGANCPQEDGPDFDFGAPPILVTLADGRDLLLAGQKSGEVFGIDPATGRIAWRRRAGMGGFNGGIHWGMASDGRTLWVGVADTPGSRFTTGPARQGMHAFDAATGRPLWSRIEKPTCDEPGYACMTALSAPVTAIPGVVFAGAHNGRLLAYPAGGGSPLWMAETNRSFTTVNGVTAKGGTIDGQGPVVGGGMVVVNSGYDKFGEIAGNVLLVYRVKGTVR